MHKFYMMREIWFLATRTLETLGDYTKMFTAVAVTSHVTFYDVTIRITQIFE